ncbi:MULTISPECIES: Ig-like domain-containing protein [Enterobacter]|uniref:Ig-like domain-containing protein n=1 Tax=Enterobacter TaxID=547 RepID=UPI000940FA32|nr:MULTISPECIES: inverse autotransporter beta domain-containing protein [Enterobacter]
MNLFKTVAQTLIAVQLLSAITPAFAGGFSSHPESETTASENLARAASSLGSVLSQNNVSGSVSSQAAGMASNMAGDALEGWMQQYGTVKVQLSVDNHGKWDNSSVDWLLPFYESSGNILFTQLGYRAPEGHQTFNMGLGVRTFSQSWMYGMNVFFDDDRTGHNRRAGIGVEAWRDYLKLSANSYFGLTDWHNSRDLADYDERPADGWDVRAEAYLPAYPQLGGKLAYEQYRGNEVAFIDKDNRQRNPSAVTTGLSYSPFPLATVGVDYRSGTDGQNETQFSLKFHWQPDTPLRDQLNPDAIRMVRTLAGSRLDLVERNNAIVLNYRKQDLLKLALPGALQGAPGNTLTVNASVSSKYPVSRTEWNVASLLAAGGKITDRTSRTLNVILPPWQASGVNQYAVSAVSYDTHGNTSNTAMSTITVLQPGPVLANGSVTVLVNNAPADGKSADKVLAIVTDDNGNPLSGQKVNFTATNGAVVTTLNGITGADGQAKASLTSTTAGKSDVMAMLDNGQQASVTTIFVGVARIAAGDLTVTQNNAAANGTAQNAVQAKVTDGNNQPVAGQTVTFTATNGATVATINGTTGADGLAKASLTSTTVGNSVVTSTLANGTSASVTTAFTPLNGIALRNVTVSRNNALADGTDVDTVTMTVTDSDNVPVAGQSITLRTNNGAVITPASVTTDSSGAATINLTSLNAGNSVLTAALGNGSTATVTVNFIIAAQILPSDMTVVTNNAPADGHATNELTAKVTNGQGTAVAGQIVTFTATNGGTVSTINGTTGADGLARARVTSTTTGDSVVTAALSNGCQATATVNFITDTQIEANSLIVTNNNAVADGRATDAVQLRVINGNGMPVAAQPVTFMATNGAIITASVTTGADGIARARLTSSTAGSSMVKATLTSTGETASVIVTFMPNYSDFAGIQAQGQDFAMNSGFPTTGFSGAWFELKLPAGLSPDDFTWSSSASWLSLSRPVRLERATMNGSGGSGSVTITAMPNSGSGATYRFTFSLRRWFIWNDGNNADNATYNRTWCSSRGYQTPSYQVLTSAAPFRKDGARGVGSLWGEWGDILGYNTDPITISSLVYMTDESDSAIQYSVRLSSGWVYDVAPTVSTIAICTKNL